MTNSTFTAFDYDAVATDRPRYRCVTVTLSYNLRIKFDKALEKSGLTPPQFAKELIRYALENKK